MRLAPAPGRMVRDPKTTQHIPESGIEVVSSSYWLRRLAEGDVLQVAPVVIPDSLPENAK